VRDQIPRPSASYGAGTAQIEGQREIGRTLLGRQFERTRRMSMVLEARKPARLRLEAIDRKGLVVAAARMRHMIDAAAQRAAVPAINDIEGQGRMDRNRRMQTIGGLPGLEAHPATASPEVPVAVKGTRRPLQATKWRPCTSPLALSCKRSTEEST